MKYCKRCVYPESAVNLIIYDDGICSSCKFYENYMSITDKQWQERKKVFEDILEENLKKNNSFDVVVPVSGGKDSYFQTHVVCKQYNLKPLLITYEGNNFLPEGIYNRDRMRFLFDADHIIWGPSIEVIKKMNRLGFKKMGDMNWHNHCGIFSAPINLAVKFEIPIIIWGEINWDISGMFDPNDFMEFSARVRHEHDLRGFEWYNFLNDKIDYLSEKDFDWAKYPSDEDILRVGVRGLHLGNYFKWDPNNHSEEMKRLYNWKPCDIPPERTYRNFSNLDDRYENGIHDLLKFYKFGYGRCSDHASKDVRTGYMSRSEAIEMVKKYDDVVSSDLDHWLKYVDMKEQEFFKIADSFRDPKVWWIENNKWHKHNLWGGSSDYGDVYIDDKSKEKYYR